MESLLTGIGVGRNRLRCSSRSRRRAAPEERQTSLDAGVSGLAPLEPDSGRVVTNHEGRHTLALRVSRVRRARQIQHRQQAQMNLRLHERARHADVRQAPCPDLGLRHEADPHVRRLPSPPSVFHDNPGMARPSGDGPLRSMLPPFHATAVTLSSRSGDRLSSIGTPSPASDALVGPCCAAFAPRAEDGAAVGPVARDGDRLGCARFAQWREHVMRLSKVHGVALSALLQCTVRGPVPPRDIMLKL
jgi:hypothetical protein